MFYLSGGYPGRIFQKGHWLCALRPCEYGADIFCFAHGHCQRNPPPGCIHHADRCVHYASKDYIKELEPHQFHISVSRKGNLFANAYVESFMKTLKSEEVHLWKYHTMEDVQRRIPYFIEDVYNHKRLHAAIG